MHDAHASSNEQGGRVTDGEFAMAAGDEEENRLEKQLMEAAERGDTDRVAKLLAEGADSSYQDEETGTSVLMAAAGNGHLGVVQALLNAGAPWNALDRRQQCAGELAHLAGHEEVAEELLLAGVRAEMLFSTLARMEAREDEAASRTTCGAAADSRTEATAASRGTGSGGPNHSKDYLQQRVRYEPGEGGAGEKLLDEDGEAVMMDWERPLMIAHAECICQGKGDVLNIGFGLGLVDQAIQERQPRSHTIIEAHPDVHAYMMEAGWGEKPGVKVVFGRWQDVIDELGPFDGIFFDTYGEYGDDMRLLHSKLKALLRPDGVYSFFNGFCPDNLFFQAVYSEVMRMDLVQEGLDLQFLPLPVDVSQASTWSGVKNRYFNQDVYHLPVVTWKEEAAAAGDAAAACAGSERGRVQA